MNTYFTWMNFLHDQYFWRFKVISQTWCWWVLHRVYSLLPVCRVCWDVCFYFTWTMISLGTYFCMRTHFTWMGAYFLHGCKFSMGTYFTGTHFDQNAYFEDCLICIGTYFTWCMFGMDIHYAWIHILHGYMFCMEEMFTWIPILFGCIVLHECMFHYYILHGDVF